MLATHAAATLRHTGRGRAQGQAKKDSPPRGVAVVDQVGLDATVSPSELRTTQMPQAVSTWDIAGFLGAAACAEGGGSYLRLSKYYRSL